MIELIDHVVDGKILESAVKRYREKGIILPTFAQQKDPTLVPEKIKEKLKTIGLWDLDPLNLFRITWHNEPRANGGLFGRVNYMVLPPELTGVKATIVALIGKWFPTGAHKVGAAYGCLAPRITTGQFDPEYHKAVWPSTGNYCRGGAFDSYIMGCTAVAILPEEMSASNGCTKSVRKSSRHLAANRTLKRFTTNAGRSEERARTASSSTSSTSSATRAGTTA